MSYNIDTNITSIQGFKAIDMATDNIKKILQGDLHHNINLNKLIIYWFNLYNVLHITEPPVVLDLESELLEASKAGELEKVQRVLTAYPHIVNCRDLDGR